MEGKGFWDGMIDSLGIAFRGPRMNSYSIGSVVGAGILIIGAMALAVTVGIGTLAIYVAILY